MQGFGLRAISTGNSSSQYFNLATCQYRSKCAVLFLLLLAYSFSNTVLANTAPVSNTQLQAKPKIALVLAGGGAKGAAHIGALHVLEQHNIPVHIVTGTSIGSVVGGLYALGYNADEIKQRMFRADFNRGYSDTIARKDLPYRDKLFFDRFNIPLSLGYADGEIKLPGGLLQGQTMKRLLREVAGLSSAELNFDQLAIPYRAISTDLNTRESYIFSSGDIIKAMRASSSVPGALAPVKHDGRLLIDGGISNNIPVAQAIELGADIVIAIDISGKLLEKQQTQTALGVVGQLTSFLTQEGTSRQLAKLRAEDILIEPDITDIAMTDFSSMDKAYLAGVAATEQALEQLKVLSVDDRQYAVYQQQKIARRKQLIFSDPIVFQSVQLDNQSATPDAFIDQYIKNLRLKPTSTEEILNSIDDIYASNEFEKVDLSISTAAGQSGKSLSIQTYGKSWGPNFFNFGIGFEEDTTDKSNLNLDFAYTIKNITDNGGEWSNQLEIGFERDFISELYFPLTSSKSSFSRLQYEYKIEVWDTLVAKNDIEDIRTESHTVELGIGYNFSSDSLIEIGLIGDIGDIGFEENRDGASYDSRGSYITLAYDNLNRVSFPTRGNQLVIDYKILQEKVRNGIQLKNVSFNENAGRYQTEIIDLAWKGAINIEHHTLVGKLRWNKTISDSENSVYTSRLGGFLNLSGYSLNELVANESALALISYQWDLGRDAFGFSQYPLYLGLSLETGSVIAAEDKFSRDNLIQAGSVFLGTDTALGPIVFAFGVNDNQQQNLYLYLGKNF